MAIQTEPTRIQIPFADSGTKNVIPDTNSTPSASQAASWTDGFPAQCSLPLSAGGIPPARADFNGIFNTMTQSIRYGQEGGVWAWDATVDYGTNRVVLGSDGLLYWSVAQSGPNVGGAQDPTADTSHTYWTSPKVPMMPVTDRSTAAVNSQWVSDWRDSLVAATDYYVDPTNGDDSNDGLTSSTAKKTVANVLSLISVPKVPCPEVIKIHLTADTYNETLIGVSNGQSIHFVGPNSGVASFNSFGFGQNNNCSFYGRFQTRGTITVNRGATVFLANGSYINIHNLGSTNYAINVYINAVISNNANASATIEFTGTSSFARACARTDSGGKIAFLGGITVTNSGTVSGQRYACYQGSGISGTGSTTLFPGTSNGQTDATSYYS